MHARVFKTKADLYHPRPFLLPLTKLVSLLTVSQMQTNNVLLLPDLFMWIVCVSLSPCSCLEILCSAVLCVTTAARHIQPDDVSRA